MITICLIEDLEEIMEGLKTIVSSSDDFKLLKCFVNAEDAIRVLPDLKPDIILTDINLPGKSGIDCIHEMKPILIETQFIMFTIYEDDDQVFEALKAGASGYILKNTSSEKILDALRELRDGGSPMSPKIARKVLSSFNQSKSPNLVSELLSKREMEVLELLSKGFLYKEIADKLGIAQSYISMILSGDRTPGLKLKKKIERELAKL